MTVIAKGVGGHIRNHWNASDRVRAANGEWIHALNCPTFQAARKMVRNIEGGTFEAWQPEGSFEAKFVLGELDYEIHVRQI